MDETREQFRDRMGEIAYDAWLASDSPTTESLHGAYCDIGEAVYAEALRDVMQLERDTPDSLTSLDKLIERFARERGIDL